MLEHILLANGLRLTHSSVKKCAYCGMLNDDLLEECVNCGCESFERGRAKTANPEPPRKVLRSVLPAERHGSMVKLKCRTPAEANLVRESLGSGDVLAVVPDEEEMWRQYEKHGFVQVQVSAAAYDADPGLRSVVEFSTDRVAPKHATERLGTLEKIFAAVLGVVIVPGLLVYVGVQIHYENKGYDQRAREFKKWFVVGLGAWLIVFLYCCFRF